VISDPSDPKHLFHDDLDASSEGVICSLEDEVGGSDDTDYDLEEANAAMI
jgi:hypothetical protein